ncbi:MAG: amino acid permease [Bdellovibrionales bacterium]|nr:amino acid permease [Bdellovibrionales bacterium]
MMDFSQLLRKKPIDKIMVDSDHESHSSGMTRSLTVLDLTSFGIAAIIGAGIFSTIGTAASHGGPAVSFLFIFTAIACGFSALCYAQFASTIPVSGSAYTYAYASTGELVAWIIGWNLVMEYAIGNIAVAISWSDYFTAFLHQYHIPFPNYLSMDFLTAKRGFEAVSPLLAQGSTLEAVAQQQTHYVMDAYNAYVMAPRAFNIPVVMDIPALMINVLCTWIVYIGIRESKKIANAMVLLKIIVVLTVIVVGSFYIHPTNWVPFAPNGISGVLKGVSGVFFAYIGFDAISTTAEECKNPRRDLPLGMFFSLLISTVLYVLISLVLTGMVPFTSLNVGDPLAYVFGPQGANLPWVSSLVAGSAIVALFSVLLVFQLGQPRIWMVMGRDGLLPKIFGELHPQYKTPWFATIVTGFVVGIPCLFMNLTEVTDLTSIGTLFAFLIVCIGTLLVDNTNARFKIWYINSQWIFPVIAGGILYFMLASRPELLNPFNFEHENFANHMIAYFYIIFLIFLVVWSFRKKLSLIPVLGATTCSYLMTELGYVNWIRFGAWLLVGLAIYFLYGMKRSALRTKLT